MKLAAVTVGLFACLSAPGLSAEESKAGAPPNRAAAEKIAAQRCRSAVPDYSQERLTPEERQKTDSYVRNLYETCMRSGVAAVESELEMRRQEEAEIRARAAQNERDRAAALQKQEEEARLRAAQAQEQDRVARLVLHGRDDPAIVQVVASGNVCHWKRVRSETLRDIADEKRLAKRVGVVNLSKLEDLKDDLRTAEANLSHAGAALHRMKRPALSCSDAKVLALQECYDAAEYPAAPLECAEDAMRIKVLLFRED